MDELAEIIGAKPNVKHLLLTDPLLGYRVLTGPNLAYVYRLQGPHPWSGARRAILDVWDRIDAPARTRPIETMKNQFDWIKMMIAISAVVMLIAWIIR
jgi:dimethylaniline monooxygenase (N-oxide forming)